MFNTKNGGAFLVKLSTLESNFCVFWFIKQKVYCPASPPGNVIAALANIIQSWFLDY